MLLIKHHVRLSICSGRIMRHIAMYNYDPNSRYIIMMCVVNSAPCNSYVRLYMEWMYM